jgi:RING-type zinc-finger
MCWPNTDEMDFRYVNANYRFIVDPRGDYKAQAVDPDIHLDWNSVVQVLASAQTQCSACPICLSTPTAPRMAKCGHIFCLPCLIRYMHSDGDSKPVPEKKARWKKCPICWDSIFSSETRPVRWFTGQEGNPPREGADVVLRLVMRHPGSTLALPRDGADSLSKVDDIPWHFAAEVSDYARVMKGTEDYMLSQFDLEITQLEQQEREDEVMFGEDTEWTKKAINSIRESKERTRGIGNSPNLGRRGSGKVDKEKGKKKPIRSQSTDENVPQRYLVDHVNQSEQNLSEDPRLQSRNKPSEQINALNLSSSSIFSDGVPQTRDVRLPTSTAQNVTASSATLEAAVKQPPGNVAQAASAFYFYESLVHYYLSPLDIRILKAAFGDYSTFPSTILPCVERVSTGHIVDDELRKRAKYLQHLPYGCEVGFLECEWTDVVGPEILSKFTFEIERRRKRNKDKEAKEEKERLRAEKEEHEKGWAAPRRRRSISRLDSISLSEFQPLSAGDGTNSSWGVDGASVSPPSWSSQGRNRTGSAFASLASPSTSPTAPRTVWGTALVTPVSPSDNLEHIHGEQDNSEPDGWLQNWEEEFLSEDLAQISIGEASSASTSNARVSQGANKGKKKGKKITLMSTNIHRGA